MAETITISENCIDTSTTVIADATNNTTTTETCTDNQTTTITRTPDDDEDLRQCPCGNLDLCKLVEQTRCWAFKSSNIAAANANAVMIFAMKLLQQILIQECKSDTANVNNVFLTAAAIAELSDAIKVYNPPPFNS